MRCSRFLVLGAVLVGLAAALALGGGAAVRAERGAEPQRWKGVIELPGSPLRFAIVVDAEATPPTGHMSIQQQGVKESALRGVVAAGKVMKFTFGTEQMPAATHAHFDMVVADDGLSASGTMKQMGMNVPVRMTPMKEGEETGPVRPQHPRRPYPYGEREVLVLSADGAKLTGTLTVPDEAAHGKGPHPAAVMITGSGPQDRDETLMDHKPFLVIADHLTRAGIAVLRVDDRGWAGNFDPKGEAATTDDFVLDAAACAEWLAEQPEVDAKRIGLVGHSEGGLIAPMVAAKDARVAWLVLLAGTGVRGDEIVKRQVATIPAAAGAPADTPRTAAAATALVEGLKRNASNAELLELLRALGRAQTGLAEGAALPAELERNIAMSAVRMNSPWFKRFLVIDPAEHLRRVKVPVLALNGSLDMQVEAGPNLAGIAAALKEGGNGDVETREMKGLNHLFQHATTGGMNEYAMIEETFAVEALEAISAWVRKRCGMKP